VTGLSHRSFWSSGLGDDMRVPDFMLKCVGFVAEYVVSPVPSAESFDLEGTGFFVNIPSSVRPANNYFVFVTAKHIAKSLQDRLTVVTVNQKGGGIAVLEDTDDKWYLHPDESVDVAVMAFTPTPNLDIKSIPLEMFLDKASIEGKQIGIGDEVYMPGLFTYVASERRNAPILRHGNIAMITDEPIQVDAGFAEVYLIEARSIGGMSGSPVFVRNTMSLKNKTGQTLHGVSGESSLLGLVHGHWDVKESEINEPSFVHDRKRGVNLGIAVVVPASKILEVINHPGLVHMRDEAGNK
jgi:hypothetical protein